MASWMTLDERRLSGRRLCLRCWVLSRHLNAFNIVTVLRSWPVNQELLLVLLFSLWVNQNVLLSTVFIALLLRKVHHCSGWLRWNETQVVHHRVSLLIWRLNHLLHWTDLLLWRSDHLILLYICFSEAIEHLPVRVDSLGRWVLTVWGAFWYTLEMLRPKRMNSFILNRLVEA